MLITLFLPLSDKSCFSLPFGTEFALLCCGERGIVLHMELRADQSCRSVEDEGDISAVLGRSTKVYTHFGSAFPLVVWSVLLKCVVEDVAGTAKGLVMLFVNVGHGFGEYLFRSAASAVLGVWSVVEYIVRKAYCIWPEVCCDAGGPLVGGVYHLCSGEVLEVSDTFFR